MESDFRGQGIYLVKQHNPPWASAATLIHSPIKMMKLQPANKALLDIFDSPQKRMPASSLG
jgi:hypothetical protein